MDRQLLVGFSTFWLVVLSKVSFSKGSNRTTIGFFSMAAATTTTTMRPIISHNICRLDTLDGANLV